MKKQICMNKFNQRSVRCLYYKLQNISKIKEDLNKQRETRILVIADPTLLRDFSNIL